MRQRANLILVENGKHTVYYDHWAANSLDRYLFWGEEKAVEFFKNHEKFGDEWWLDDVWGEGGAVIDLDKKVLLWFGGEDVLYNIPLRRMLLKLMEKIWYGYKIIWAYGGIPDLAEYVGYNKTRLINKHLEFTPEKILKHIVYDLNDKEYNLDTITINDYDNKIRIYPNYNISFIKELLFYGLGLFNIALKNKYESSYEFTSVEEFPTSGIHIDLPRKKLYFWTSNDGNFPIDEIKEKWIDFEIINCKDNYEIHLELTKNKLIFPKADEETLIKMVKNIVCFESHDPMETINSTINAIIKSGKNLEVSPNVFIGTKFESNKEVLETLFDKLFII